MPTLKITEAFTEQGREALAPGKHAMKRYTELFDSYEQLLQSCLLGTQLSKIGLKQLKHQIEYMGLVTEAFSMIANATDDLIQKTIGETLPEMSEVAQIASDFALETARKASPKARPT
jgi:hypothetical protein